ncbi:ATP-binding protein [Paraburkholderia rhizosphaerae]|uniref:Virulence sensor protein BvgS n=1 Tax=Paraburkholderia rhizosphaerae TaxID=480658 RepID=A0A4R8M2J3_9BURK|nr:ATP-binding protein [Paraburkholderia rhizosphaerae]TDY54638.1 two-component system capsular synthesis sensor histidine kinase RcsC [Paraburkholderia rhizosphaerae]
MPNILDRTHESLADAFASLAANARRQQRLYFATLIILISIVAFSMLLLAVLAIDKQLDLQRRTSAQNAADVSLLLHRAASFLVRTELTVQFYRQTRDVHHAPDELVRQISESGVALSHSSTLGIPFSIVVSDATRAAWHADLSTQLWRLTEAADATLATREAFELPYRAFLIGLDDDYAAILPAIDPAADPHAPPLDAGLAATLRDTLLRELAAQTGKRTLAKGDHVLVGPYSDPLSGAPVVSTLSIQSADGAPAVLIAMTLPTSGLLAGVRQPAGSTTVLLRSIGYRPIASTSPHATSTIGWLRELAARTPPGGVRQTWRGVVFVDAATHRNGLLVSYIPWRAVFAATALQLGAILGFGLLLIAGMVFAAKFWGMRLLRKWHDESLHALQSETINHIVVSATPVGLCIVRQRDFSVMAANQLARGMLHLGNAAGLPPHIAAAYTERSLSPSAAVSPLADKDAGKDTDTGRQPAHKQGEFIVPALAGRPDGADAQMLQVNYQAARHEREDVLFCSILDISARHRLGEQLRAAQRETEAMMRTQSNFFAAMSHEIRTPMNALLGNLELLSRSPGLEQHEQRVRAVGIAADSLRRIVNDILDFSKIDAGMMKLVDEPFNPLDALESLALSYAPLAAGRPLNFHAYLSPALHRCWRGDRTRVVQIVNNLLSNAFKFTSSGRVVLSAHVRYDEEGDASLVCRVSDSGIGMDAQQVARIFKPFVQAEPGTASRFGGTGLGLSICVRLCELMGGKIAVESVQGVGSAFTVTLPLRAYPEDEAGGAANRGALSEPRTARGAASVLCQEPAAAEWLDEVLTQRGWQPTCVTSPDAASTWLRVNRPAFMIVTAEYRDDVIAQLRASMPDATAAIIWMTRDGPLSPGVRGDRVFEVSEFSQHALAAAIELAVNGVERGGTATGIGTAHDAASLDHTSLDHTSHVAAERVRPTASSALSGLRILVAEDNPLNRTLVADQLTTLGCVPTVVGDGKQALAVLAQAEADLVLTDIHMPVMDGYALMAALRDTWPSLPVIAFSAVTGAEQTLEWRQRGFAGCIPKPASLQQLQAALLALREGAHDLPPHAAYDSRHSSDAAAPDTLDAVDKSLYLAMLKDHLSTDLPRLAGIVDACDRTALRDWAHSAGGAFLIVREPQFADQCRELQRMCDAADTWTPAIAHYALALHDGLRSHFGLDEPSLH